MSTASNAYGLALRRSYSISDQHRMAEGTVFTDHLLSVKSMSLTWADE